MSVLIDSSVKIVDFKNICTVELGILLAFFKCTGSYKIIKIVASIENFDFELL